MTSSPRDSTAKTRHGEISLLPLLILTLFAGIWLGDVRIPLADLPEIILAGRRGNGQSDAFQVYALWHLRLPRVVVSLLAGAIWTTSGVLLQTILKSSTADGTTTGVSAGALFGGVCARLIGAPALHGFAFVGSASAFFISFALCEICGGRSRRALPFYGLPVSALLLLAASALFVRGLGYPPSALVPVLWGSFSNAGWYDAYRSVIVLCAMLCICSLALGKDEENEPVSRGVGMLFAAAACSAMAYCTPRFGLFAFSGLLAPQMIDATFPATGKRRLSLCILAGAAVFCAFDTLARISGNLPAGIFVAAAGFLLFGLTARTGIH